ncbi:SMP-30/gluconolactonase/LRE family protein [Parabacteroides sp. PF5-9]|uniref:SMP-30/gluconolactonase/LRE family protein n=1 Tax=Parabacteroides sp. PF5-9 TaxID=1742404 RepID=UPI002473CE63|nr:SMP-30/gluconolactonase/LRE family protein [Parabacteroides sp. PF5-9]MDH6357546.1 gluconolactonase [Parabacteroides sp. PF5-9]
MKTTFIISLFTLLIPSMIHGQQRNSGLIAPGAELEVLAKAFAFTEGPAVDKNGNVYFTDQPNDRIYVWSVDGKLTLFQEGQGRANGLYFDKNGNLLSCSDMENEIRSIDMHGNYTAFVTAFDGKKLNGPNDLWPDPNGGIYFTDPLYKRDYWNRDPEMQQDGEYVYYLSPDHQSLVRVATDLKKPNGIIGTPDGKKLYIADIGDRKTYVYDIQPDGSLINKKLFTEMGSDGITMDEKGNIYLTGRGVTVFNPQGEQIEHIPIETGWTANVCFGGKDMQTLFITATEYLYALKMNVKGIR